MNMNVRDTIKESYRFTAGTIPLLISFPHVGTELTDSVANGLVPEAKLLPDTDWHVDRLYAAIAEQLGASTITAGYSRYVVDLNRPADDAALYASKTPGLFPDALFDSSPLFKQGQTPSDKQRQVYLSQIWQPYHQRIAQTLAEMRQQFGYAILYDAHSIASVVPSLFEGKLPDLNIGSNSGAAATVELEQQALAACEQAKPDYSCVANGRFKGGYITREYGKPAEKQYALQMELSQATYMNESAPFDYREDKAQQIQPVLTQVLENIVRWGQAHGA